MSSLFMKFPGGKAKALTLSYDDGVEQDKRLISILNKHGMKCTFNLNSGVFAPEGTVYPKGQVHRRMTEKEVYETYANSGHEVAVHSYTHPFLEELPESEVINEIIEDRKKLESMFGTVVRGMAYPFGTYSDGVVDTLKKCGIVYSRTTRSTEKFDIPSDWLRLPATCHHNNPNLMTLADRFVNEKPGWKSWLFYLWGHSYEFDGNDNWNVIEEFAEKVGDREDIWYATNIEIYDYVKAFRSLIYTADMSKVYNPTLIEVFFKCNGKEFSVKPGEKIKIKP